MPPIHIFVSYDGEHDSDLHDRLHAESTRSGSTFEFSARTQGGEMTEAWTARARTRIRAADEVVILCGEHSDSSERMAAEMRIVQEESKPYMLLWGRRELMCTKPVGAKPTDAMYSWTREILAAQLSEALRAAAPIAVPERLRRTQS